MRFVDEHSHRFAVAVLLRVLNIAESTYYQWVKQAGQPCDRDLVDLGLISNIHEIWETSGRTYGADRVHRQLRRDGIRVSRKRVERLMAAHGWQGAFLRRGWRGGSTGSSPRLARTGYGSPTPPASRVVRGCSGWLRSAMCSPAGSSAGRPPTAATPT
jgi:putative transposase